jgi:Phage capsid family
MKSRPLPVRLRPDYSYQPRAADYLTRAVAAVAHEATFKQSTAVEFAREEWGDHTTEVILRAATTQATITDPGWAGSLARAATGDFVASLAPISAGARLIAQGVRVPLDDYQQVNIPQRVGAIDPSAVGWVVEGKSVPVVQFALGSKALGPVRKLAGIPVVTRELAESSAAEEVIAQVLRENTAMSLDASLFSDAAATTARPAGLLNGVTPLTPTTGGDEAAMLADLVALAKAISAATANLAIAANPAQANAIRLSRGTTFPPEVQVWSSIAIPTGTVIALDPAAFCSGFGSVPEEISSTVTMLNMNTAPPDDPLAGPKTQSLWQVDCIATMLKLRCAWTWRVDNAVAWIQGASW